MSRIDDGAHTVIKGECCIVGLRSRTTACMSGGRDLPVCMGLDVTMVRLCTTGARTNMSSDSIYWRYSRGIGGSDMSALIKEVCTVCNNRAVHKITTV